MKRYFVRYIFTLLLVCSYGLSVHARDVIKVLAIGNSFSEDAIENYLYELAKAAGDSMVIGNLYIGGCSLQTHDKNAQSDAAAYSYRKIVGGIKTKTEKQTLSVAIADEPWDYISFQQASPYSGLYDTYFPYLNNLLTYVKARATNPDVRYIFHRTWAYAADSKHDGFKNYHNNQQEMYTAIVSSTQRVMKDVPEISILVPAGTAIQNVRTSSIGDKLCRDGYHLELTYGRYTAACTWLEALTGKSAVGNAYIPETISKEKALIAQHAAHAAIRKPRKVTSMARFNAG